jgi:hypothetical protein
MLPVAAQTLEAGAIVVTVTDVNTGKPIDNAQVFLLGGDSPESSLTNVKGVLVFENVQPGSYHVRVDAPGYEQTNTAVEVGEAQRARVSVALAPSAQLKTIASVVSKASVVNVNIENINSESAQRRVSQTLSDALNKLAGVSVDSDLYGAGSSFNVSLRGADSSQTGYSVDGIRIPGAAGQAISGAQDLFTGASVNFAPSAGNNAGTINFNTLQPSKLWTYGFNGALGNYSRTLGAWSATGGFGKASFAFAHSGGGQVGALNGAVFQDQSGATYMHSGGFSRNADLVKVALALSPVSTFKYALIGSVFNSTNICASATTMLPCSYGPNNVSRSENEFQTLGFASLLGHVQFNTDTAFGKTKIIGAEPSRAVNGVIIPSFSESAVPFASFDLRFSSTARRHTLTGGFFEGSQNSTFTSTFSGPGPQTVRSEILTRYATAYLSLRTKASEKLTFQHEISQSSATNSAPAFEIYEDLTWTPSTSDVIEGGFGVGGASGFGAFSPTLGDAVSADYDCFNHSVFVQGPSDQPGPQSALTYNLAWRHTLRGGFVNVSLYRNHFVGQNQRGAVPIGAEPSSLFPGGSLSDYLASVQQVWSNPAVCGSAPFDPGGVYVSQTLSGLSEVTQGFSLTGEIPLGKDLIVFPTYATTNVYYSELDPRLLGPNSYYGIGTQVPRIPLHKAGLIIDGIVPHTPLEWLADAEFTSANNQQNLPAYTIYNAGLVVKLPRGSLSVLAANILGTQSALFATYQGVNPMPLQGGGTFAFSTIPLPPRSLTLQYQIRWKQHFQPPPPLASPKPAASASPAPKG